MWKWISNINWHLSAYILASFMLLFFLLWSVRSSGAQRVLPVCEEGKLTLLRLKSLRSKTHSLFSKSVSKFKFCCFESCPLCFSCSLMYNAWLSGNISVSRICFKRLLVLVLASLRRVDVSHAYIQEWEFTFYLVTTCRLVFVPYIH